MNNVKCFGCGQIKECIEMGSLNKIMICIKCWCECNKITRNGEEIERYKEIESSEVENINTVYRIQNRMGIGPYRGDFNSKKQELQDMIKRHNDFIFFRPEICQNVGQFSGFLSLEQLYNWFSQEEISMLKKYKYFIYEIKKVKIVREDSRQILFEKCTEWHIRNQKKIEVIFSQS